MAIVVKPSIDAINALLPQTQCGQCGYPGCKPYATAIAQGEAIHLCPPGGLTGLQQLTTLTGQAITPAMQDALLTRLKKPFVARIREDECIGCTKCIQACPVDAIIGAAKQLHVILTADCTGCELCIDPCPVDCIDLIAVDRLSYQIPRAKAHFEAKLTRNSLKRTDPITTTTFNSDAKKRFISEAVARAKAKKSLINDSLS